MCFPELCSTMYFCHRRDDEYFAWAGPIDGPSVRRAALAERIGAVVVFPFFGRAGSSYYNTAAVIGPDGSVIGRYLKTCIPFIKDLPGLGRTESDEQYYFSPATSGIRSSPRQHPDLS